MTLPRIVRIDDASFMMGSTERDDERPVHRVRVDAFELGVFQITNREYDEFVRSTSRGPAPFRDDPNFHHLDQPVVAVSWLDAVTYCEWLSAATGRRFRLPTEAEWECAARGGVEDALYPWGNTPRSRPPGEMRWKNGPEPVGRGEPNRFGLHDLCENVHEWCSDWYAADSYASSPECNPQGPSSGSRRVSRGGSWRHHVKVTRCAARSSIAPDLHYGDYGFRVACDPA